MSIHTREYRELADKIEKAKSELETLKTAMKDLDTDTGLLLTSSIPGPIGLIADIASLAKSLKTGDIGGAMWDLVGLFPVLGDAAKLAGKGGRIAKQIANIKQALKKAEEAIAKGTKKLEALRRKSKPSKRDVDDAVANSGCKTCGDNVSGVKNIPSHTKPTGVKGGKPTGPRTKIEGSSTKKKALERENESADILAEGGYKVEQNPGKRPDNNKEPDYKIEGEYADNYAPQSNNIDKVRKTISNKVKGQAQRIVVNLSDTNITTKEVQDILKRKPVNGLEEVIGITKDKKIIKIYP